ncbi:MAG: RNA polymerase sigma factor [Butyricimonas virosa]
MSRMQNGEKINIRRREVFDSYFRRYYQTLCYFAYHYLKEQDEAEDVVQDVFMKLLNWEESFDNEEHLKHYLYKAVRNSCLNQIKTTGIRSDILESIQKNAPEDENNFFVNVVRAEVYQEIMEAIQELPTECGRVFRLAYVDGFSNEEIATQLSISVNTVKVQKNKAKIQLREKLKGLYPLLLFL